jgi:hypothetical protein
MLVLSPLQLCVPAHQQKGKSCNDSVCLQVQWFTGIQVLTRLDTANMT